MGIKAYPVAQLNASDGSGFAAPPGGRGHPCGNRFLGVVVPDQPT